jgi:hypothetical protein
MNTAAFQNAPEPLTVVCRYDFGARQFIVYGVYGSEVSEETLRQRYAEMPHVRFVRQFKNMHQPHVAFTLKEPTKVTA